MAGFAKANTRIGFAQVERNHMSGGEAEARIHAQLPADTTAMGTVLENGRFAKYNYACGVVCDLTGDYAAGESKDASALEWEMIYNEEMLYDERLQNHKDFALQAKNYTKGELVPRLIAVEVGDIFTTNAIGEGSLTAAQIGAITENSEATITLPAQKAILGIANNGYLVTKPESYTGPEFQVVKVYTLADSQPAVKLMRIK